MHSIRIDELNVAICWAKCDSDDVIHKFTQIIPKIDSNSDSKKWLTCKMQKNVRCLSFGVDVDNISRFLIRISCTMLFVVLIN